MSDRDNANEIEPHQVAAWVIGKGPPEQVQPNEDKDVKARSDASGCACGGRPPTCPGYG